MTSDAAVGSGKMARGGDCRIRRGKLEELKVGDDVHVRADGDLAVEILSSPPINGQVK